MERTYSEADKVVVSLSESTAAINEAIDALLPLAEALSGVEATAAFDNRRMEKYALPVLDSTIWIGLYELFDGAWSKRVGVLQKAVLARNLEYRCGGENA